MEQNKPYFLNVKLLRKLLIAADDIIHFAIATILMICAVLILANTIPSLLHPTTSSIIHILNDVLLALIVMELMWPIVRFLKRKPFKLNPFLYIGIISSIRRILLIEAEHSTLTMVGQKNIAWPELWPVLAEMGTNVLIILILAISLYLLSEKGSNPLEDKD